MPHADVRQFGELLIQQQRGVLILRVLREQIVGQFELHQIEEEFAEVMSLAETAVVIDCQRISGHASSEFLSMLLRLQRQLKAEGMTLGICGLTGPLAEAYRVCRFERVVNTFHTSHEAVQSLGRFNQRSLKRVAEGERREALAKGTAWLESLRDSLATGSPRVRLVLIAVAGMLVAWVLLGFVSSAMRGSRAGLRRRMERASRGRSGD